jgi:phage terminase large subunit
MEVHEYFDIAVSTIAARNGSTIIFEGLKNNTTKIKSMEGIDIVWCEEAEAITEYSWDLLIPTIRKQGSEVWISFNPADEMDATYTRFVTPYLNEITESGHFEDENIYVSKVGHSDNPWFPAELRTEMESCKKTNFRKYLHIWEGECNTDYEDSVIQPEWVDASIDAHKKLGFEPRGVKSLGFDPADEGTDDKAYVVRHGSVVLDCRSWGDGDLEDGTERAYQVAYEQRCTDFVYDSIGVGAGVKMKLRALNGNGAMTVEGFCGSEAPTYPDRKYKQDRKNGDLFRNKRAQWWWYLRDRFEATYRAIEHGEYLNPDDLISLSSDMPRLKLLKAELTRVQRKRGRSVSSLIQIESKQDMKSRALKSPNLADALVYSFANKGLSVTMAKPINYPRRVM